PVVEGIVAASGVIISVDTNVAAVAERAIAAGASVINDTSGLWDPRMAEVVANSDANLVLTHSVGTPRAEKPRPQYDDVVAEVVSFLRDRVTRAVDGGVPLERLIVDPGHDLNKNTVHSLELTRRFEEIVAIGLPTLAAVSNKDFIGESIDREQGQRLAGSLAAATFCVVKGARIIRMHDVRASVDAVRMTEAILGMRQPVHAIHNTDPEKNV
ncbi:MAG: dihydropteroate synthase, partial [Salinibacterium sp.]|nr:dihydropteroate synthase [Salinibacterium sp.]